MAIANLTVQQPTIPKPDFSWLDGIAQSIGGAIDDVRADRSFSGLADRLQGGAAMPQQQPTGGFLSRLAPQPQQQAQRTTQGAGGRIDPSIRDGIVTTANALGISPVDLATAISYETGGTFDPTKSGPTTQWGQHRGLIQFGEPQAQKYGVNWDDPIGSQLGENGAVANYLRDTGVKPGMGLMDIYSAINAGGVGRYDRSDANNGGAPGTVADKVNNQMAGHLARARALFGDAAAPATAADAVTAMGEGGSLASAFSGEGQAPRAPMQVADSAGGGGLIAQGVTPVQPGTVDPSIIQYMLRDRNLRETGLKLWAANAGGQKASEPWQFVNLPDGTLARANQQTGAVERLGNFAKPNGGFQVLSPEERQALNIPQTDSRVYQRGPDGKIDAVGGAGQTINVGNEVEARRQAAAQAGLTPDDPAYQGFILTGKLPRENEQSLTATDKKAILEADEMVQSTQNVLPLIDRALQLNDKAYSGPTAGLRGLVTGALGMEGGEATQELDNVVINGALTQLKAIFGGAPTEGERAILLDMSGASNQPAPVRRTIFERAKQAAERRLKFYQQRATDMRGGTYYKPGANSADQPPSAPTPPAPPSPPQAPTRVRRYNPQTGQIE